MPPKVGLRFGRYELLDKLGAGGMGEVYRARDLDLGRDVAVKFLPQRFASDPDRLARFANEARAASSLNHPNIVTIHEIGQAEGLPCIVMECVEGQTLRRLLDGRPLPPKRILELSAQVADGLAKAHGAGIVHRDLKPENLMVTPDGFVKILDFGLAKLRGPNPVGQGTAGSDEVTGLGVSPNTTAGVIIGTANYMSPEQASGRVVDYRSDQFALGAIIYEMAANRQPFRRPSAAQTLSAIIEEDPEPLASLSPSLPAPARWVVERCLAKDPADRYTSTADLARELRNVRDHLSEVSASSVSGTGPARPGRARLWRTLGVGALALLTVLAFPMLRGSVRDVFRPPLPAEKRIAVLPFRCLGDLRESQPVCDGLVEYLVARLGQIERYQRSAWVIPISEVREGGVESIDAARRALGATLAVSGSVQREGDRTVITAALSDATQGRQLRATTVAFPTGTSPLLDRTVRAIIDMLELELGPEAREMLRAGGTDVAEASDLYAQAVGYVPYSQARTALERYEQRPNLERAIELFQQALERDPDYALAHAGLGEADWRLSRATANDAHVALASEHAARALALDATLASAWVTQGIIHAGRGSAEEAVQDFQRALERNPRQRERLPRTGRRVRAAQANRRRHRDVPEGHRAAAGVLDVAQLLRGLPVEAGAPCRSRSGVQEGAGAGAGQCADLVQPWRRVLLPGEIRGRGGRMAAIDRPVPDTRGRGKPRYPAVLRRTVCGRGAHLREGDR